MILNVNNRCKRLFPAIMLAYALLRLTFRTPYFQSKDPGSKYQAQSSTSFSSLLKPGLMMAGSVLAATYNQLQQFSQTMALRGPNLNRFSDQIAVHYHPGMAYAYLMDYEAARKKLAVTTQFDPLWATDVPPLLGRGAARW